MNWIESSEQDMGWDLRKELYLLQFVHLRDPLALLATFCPIIVKHRLVMQLLTIYLQTPEIPVKIHQWGV